MSEPVVLSRASEARRGFTFIELLVTVTIVTIVAVIALPRLTDDAALRVTAASAVLSSDIEYAQVLNIAHPAEPVVVKFDTARQRYWLALAASPDTPILREDTSEPYLVVLGSGRARAADGVKIKIADIPDNTLAFDAQGGLADFGLSPIILLKLDDEAITLKVAPSTGSITEFMGDPDSLGGGEEEEEDEEVHAS